MKFVPLGDRVVILPEAKKAVTEGGIIIPEKAQKEQGRGEVIACSEAIPDCPLKPGDWVVYVPGYSDTIAEAGTSYHVVSIQHVIMVTEKP